MRGSCPSDESAGRGSATSKESGSGGQKTLSKQSGLGDSQPPQNRVDWGTVSHIKTEWTGGQPHQNRGNLGDSQPHQNRGICGTENNIKTEYTGGQTATSKQSESGGQMFRNFHHFCFGHLTKNKKYKKIFSD